MNTSKVEKLIPEKIFKEEILCVSTQTIWRMSRRGDLPPHIVLSGKRYYLPSDIAAWLETKKVIPQP